MNKTNLIIGLTTLMLLTSCGGTKYTNIIDPEERNGIRTESSEVLTMYEETFKLELKTIKSYTEKAAERLNIEGDFKEENTKIYTGSFTIDKGLLTGSTYYILNATELRHTIRLSGKGKDAYKQTVIDIAKLTYTDEEAKKLADGWEVKTTTDTTFKVTLDSTSESFSYVLLGV